MAEAGSSVLEAPAQRDGHNKDTPVVRQLGLLLQAPSPLGG